MSASGEHRQVRINGICVEEDAGTGTEQSQAFRYVGCTSDGKAIWHGEVLTDTRCDSNVPQCKLLVDGGQPGPNIATAYESQTRLPGEPWLSQGFWCPQTQQATPVPDAATIRDRVVKLLPPVGIGTTGSPATLVNLQTILWAATTTHRTLGKISVVGQPVWIKLAFAHADWTFGDGTTASTNTPGKAYDAAADPCNHILCPHYYGHLYHHTGPVTITLHVAWQASYSLDGAHYQPVDTAPLTGPASTHQLLVRQARAVLVPDPGDG